MAGQGDNTQDQPYNAQNAADQIAMQRALAARLIQTQQPKGQVVPGGPNGFYVKPSPLAQLSSTLQQGIGGLLEEKTIKEQNDNMSKERASRSILIDKLLNGTTDGTTSVSNPNQPSMVIPDTVGGQTTQQPVPSTGPAPTSPMPPPPATPPQGQPSGAMPPAMPPQGGPPGSPPPQQPLPPQAGPPSPPMSAAMPQPDTDLQPIATTNVKYQQNQRPLTSVEHMAALGDLADTGKFGEAVASSMMTHKYQYLKNDKTGRIDAVSDTNPNDHVVVTPGSGFDPDVMKSIKPYIDSTDYRNPGAMANLNKMLSTVGMPTLTPEQVAGMQSTPTETANIDVAKANVPKINAEIRVQQVTVPKVVADTSVANATVPKLVADTNLANANTGSTQVKTAVDQGDAAGKFAAAKAKATSEAAELKSLNTQLSWVQSLADKAGGKYGSIKGGVDSYLGTDNQGATNRQKLDAALNNARLQSIVGDEAGQGRVGAGLFKAYQEHSLTGSQTPDTIKAFAGQLQQVIKQRQAAAEAEARAHQYGMDVIGYKDPTPAADDSGRYAGH